MRLQPTTIIALSWLLVASCITAFALPHLGLRGATWLWVHNALCLIGAGHELWKQWRIRHQPPPMSVEEMIALGKQRMAAAQQGDQPPEPGHGP